jgi:hypothetical protein
LKISKQTYLHFCWLNFKKSKDYIVFAVQFFLFYFSCSIFLDLPFSIAFPNEIQVSIFFSYFFSGRHHQLKKNKNARNKDADTNKSVSFLSILCQQKLFFLKPPIEIRCNFLKDKKYFQNFCKFFFFWRYTLA